MTCWPFWSSCNFSSSSIWKSSMRKRLKKLLRQQSGISTWRKLARGHLGQWSRQSIHVRLSLKTLSSWYRPVACNAISPTPIKILPTMSLSKNSFMTGDMSNASCLPSTRSSKKVSARILLKWRTNTSRTSPQMRLKRGKECCRRSTCLSLQIFARLLLATYGLYQVPTWWTTLLRLAQLQLGIIASNPSSKLCLEYSRAWKICTQLA